MPGVLEKIGRYLAGQEEKTAKQKKEEMEEAQKRTAERAQKNKGAFMNKAKQDQLKELGY